MVRSEVGRGKGGGLCKFWDSGNVGLAFRKIVGNDDLCSIRKF